MLHPQWLHDVDTEHEELYPLRWYALGVISIAITIGQVDMTIVNVALPSIAQDLDATTSDLQWVMDAYTVMLAGFVLFGGGLADRFGRKGVFMLGLAIFGAASCAAVFAAEPWHLILARGAMGFGAALFFPPALSVLAVIFPPAERGRAITIWTIIGGSATALGPVLGGVLVDNFWWGSALLVNVPVAIIGLAGAALLLPTSRRPGAPRLDKVGATLSVLGLVAFVFGVIEGPNRGWTSSPIIAALVIGVVILVGFVTWEAGTDEPMVDVTVFRIAGVAAGGLAIAVGLLTLSAVLFLVPQYLQSVLGASAIVTGLLLVPFGVAFTAVALVANRIALRYGLRNVLLGALLTCAAGTLVLLGIAEAVAAVVIVVGTTIFGAGAASMVPNATTAVMNAVPTDKAGDGSAVNQITRQLGAVLGVALAGTVLADVYASKLEPALSALRQADAAVASASITGAQSVAAGLSSGSAALLEAADVAFVTGFRFALLVPVACCLIAAAVVAVVLRSADADDASQTQFDPGA